MRKKIGALDTDRTVSILEPRIPPAATAAASSAPGTLANGTIVAIAFDTDIVAARQHGRKLAVRLGFSLTDTTLVATAISELARNIVLYARPGWIELRTLEEGRRCGILVVARDNGPGIADIRRAVTGGYSTTGGLGLGLCGVKRLMDEFEIVSSVGAGTTVKIKKWLRRDDWPPAGQTARAATHEEPH